MPSSVITLRDLRRTLAFLLSAGTERGTGVIGLFPPDVHTKGGITLALRWAESSNTYNLHVVLFARNPGAQYISGETYADLPMALFHTPTVLGALGPVGMLTRKQATLLLHSTDGLIGRHGPNMDIRALVEEARSPEEQGGGEEGETEARPKDTEEVAPQGEQPSEDSEKHGGTGQSGEVYWQQQRRQCASRRHGGSGRTDDERGMDRNTQVQLQSANDLERRIDDLQRYADQHGDADLMRRATAAHHLRDTARRMTAVQQLVEEVSHRIEEADRADALAPDEGEVGRCPRVTFGGIHADPDDPLVQEFARIFHAATSRQAVAALDRLFSTMSEIDPVGEVQSPRYDPARVVREIVSRRGRLSAARRYEIVPSIRLVTVDTSGSCAGVAPWALGTAIGLARTDNRVVLVVQSNGHPMRVILGRGSRLAGRLPPVVYVEDEDASLAWYDRLITAGRIEGSVHFGDAQGSWAYAYLARRPLVWLDNYLSATLPTPQLHHVDREAWLWRGGRPWIDQHRVQWWDGVGAWSPTELRPRPNPMLAALHGAIRRMHSGR
jgi:hypothetical protein